MVFIKATKNLFKIPNANYEKDEQNSLWIESILTYDHFLVTCEELNDETITLRRSVSSKEPSPFLNEYFSNKEIEV